MNIVRSRQFQNEFFDGTLSNLDTQPFIHGSIMNKVKFTSTVDIQTISASSSSLILTIDGTKTIVSRNQGSWLDDGFTAGMNVVIYGQQFNLPFSDENRVVQSVDDDFITFATPLVRHFGDYGDATLDSYDNLGIYNTSQLTALQYNWDIAPNIEQPNYLSMLDGTQLGYYASNIGNSFTPMTRNGYINGNQTGFANVRFVGYVDLNNNITVTPSITQRFEFEHCFNVLPYALEENREDFIDCIPPQYLDDEESLKYTSKYNFKTSIIDSNQKNYLLDENNLGSIAWFGENFNSLNNEFTLDSLTYSNDDQIEYGTNNTVTAVISTIGDDFAADNVGIYVSYLPNQDDYSNNTDEFADIWSFDSVVDTIGNSASGLSGPIKGYTITQLAPKQIEVVFDVDFDNDLIKEDDYYVIAFDVASGGNNSSSSNKVLLKGDINQFYINTDIDGLLEWKDLQFYSHTTPIDEVDNFVITDSFSDFKGYVEDGALVQFEWCMPKDFLGVIENVQVKTVAYNDTTGDLFELDSFAYDLSGQVVSNGVQNININTSRGYSLDSDDVFNNVVLQTTDSRDFVFYKANLGVKFLWQDWVSLAGADTVFYDNSEQNNGLNKNVSNYSLKEGYDIRIRICTDVLKDGVITTYAQQSPTLEVCDYDEHDGWTYEIKTFDENGIDLQGKISTTGLTTICGTATDGTPYALSDLHGIIRIESSGQTQPFEILESSTLRGVDGAFIPTALDGINTLLEETTPNNYKVTALIDGSSLGANNKISFRFGCKNIPLPPPQRFSTINDSILNNIQFTYAGSIDSFGNTITDFTNFTAVTRLYFEDVVRELNANGNTLNRTVNFRTSEYVEITQTGTNISFDWSNMPTVNDLTDQANIESQFVPFNGGFTFNKATTSDVLMGQYGVDFQGSQQYYELLGFPQNDFYNAHYDVTIPFREAAEFVFTDATIQLGTIVSTINTDELIAEKGARRFQSASIGSTEAAPTFTNNSNDIVYRILTITHPTQTTPYQKQRVWVSDTPTKDLNYEILGTAENGILTWVAGGFINVDLLSTSTFPNGTYQLKFDSTDVFGNYIEDINVAEVPRLPYPAPQAGGYNGALRSTLTDRFIATRGDSRFITISTNYADYKNDQSELSENAASRVTRTYDENNILRDSFGSGNEKSFIPTHMTINTRHIVVTELGVNDLGTTIPDAPYDKTSVAARKTYNNYILQTF